MQLPFLANLAADVFAKPSALPTRQALDVCVLGSGPVASAAMLLARAQGLCAVQVGAPAMFAGHQPAVPRTYAMSPRSQAGLAQLGVWGTLHDHQVQRCEHMRVFWQRSDAFETLEPVHLSARQAGVAQLCSFVSEQDLQQALNQALLQEFSAGHASSGNQIPKPMPAHLVSLDAAPELRLSFATTLCAATSANSRPTGIEVVCADQRTVHAQLCVVAQGAHSACAAQLGLAPTVYDYGHSAVVAVLQIKTAQANQLQHLNQSAAQLMTAGDNTSAWQWLGGDTQGHDVLALLPLPSMDSDHRFGLVWSQASTQAQQWCQAAAQGNTRGLLEAIQTRCGLPADTLSLHSAVQQFALTRSTAPSRVAPHAVLVGDSAHKIHPLAGQGLNLGFDDVFTLFEVLAQREPWRSVGDPNLLARYQRRRSAEQNMLIDVIDALARRGRWPRALRQSVEQGLRLHNALPSLGAMVKRAVVKRMVVG
jgi:2-polyprenylphenol 6-hydroxylase